MDPLIPSQNSDEFHPCVVDWEEDTILDLHDVCVLFNIKAFVSKTVSENMKVWFDYIVKDDIYTHTHMIIIIIIIIGSTPLDGPWSPHI